MERQEKVVGREISPRKATTTVHGHGQVNVHKDKGPLHLGPRHQEWDGRQVRVALDFRHRSREDSGQQVKVPRAYVHRPHTTQEIGGRDGEHPSRL